MEWNNIIGKEKVTYIFEKMPSLKEVNIQELKIGNGNTFTIRFDLKEYPKNPPSKWIDREYNTIQVTLDIYDIGGLALSDWSDTGKTSIEVIEINNDKFEINLLGQTKVSCIASFVSLSSMHAYSNIQEQN